MVCEVVLWCSVCDAVLWCSACDAVLCAVLVQRSKGHGGHCLHFIVIGGHCPPLPPSPLFCMMYKWRGSGGGGGSAIRHPKISESGPQPIDTLIYLYLPPLNTFLHT